MRNASAPDFGSGKMMSTSSALLMTWRLVTSQSSLFTSMMKPDPEPLSVTSCGVANISSVQSRPLSGFNSMARTTKRPVTTRIASSAAPIPMPRIARFIRFTRRGSGIASIASRAACSSAAALVAAGAAPIVNEDPESGARSRLSRSAFFSGCAGGGPPPPSIIAPHERQGMAFPAKARAVRYSRPQLWHLAVMGCGLSLAP